jgi:hypothetical protein
MAAGDALDVDEIAGAKILDPSGVKRLHRLCRVAVSFWSYKMPPTDAVNRDRTEMCGRVVQKTPLREIRVLFETVNPVPNTARTYKGAPTDTLPVISVMRDETRPRELRIEAAERVAP